MTFVRTSSNWTGKSRIVTMLVRFSEHNHVFRYESDPKPAYLKISWLAVHVFLCWKPHICHIPLNVQTYKVWCSLAALIVSMYKLFQIFQLALCDIIVDNLNNWWPAHHSLPLMLCVGDGLLSWFSLVKNVQFLLQLVRIKILWFWASIQPCQPLCFVGVCTVTYGMQPQMWFLSLLWSSRNFCTCSLWIIFTFSTKPITTLLLDYWS